MPQYVAVAHGPQGGTVVWLGEMEKKDDNRARQYAAGGLSSITGGSKSMFKLVNENASIYWDDELMFSMYEEEGSKTRAAYEKMKREGKRGQRLLIIRGVNDREINYFPYGIPERRGLIDRIDRWEWSQVKKIDEKLDYILWFAKQYHITGWTKSAIRRDHSGKNPRTSGSQIIPRRLNATFALLRKIDKTARAIADGDNALSIGDWPNPHIDNTFPSINGRLLPPPAKPQEPSNEPPF